MLLLGRLIQTVSDLYAYISSVITVAAQLRILTSFQFRLLIVCRDFLESSTLSETLDIVIFTEFS